jgi:hypothetical protein
MREHANKASDLQGAYMAIMIQQSIMVIRKAIISQPHPAYQQAL